MGGPEGVLRSMWSRVGVQFGGAARGRLLCALGSDSWSRLAWARPPGGRGLWLDSKGEEE